MKTIAEYQATYTTMSDDQLLHLAQDTDSLVSEAKLALQAEMKNRRFGPAEIADYVREVEAIRREEKQQRPLAQTLNGFGTTLYGERDYEPTGSYLTTLWIVCVWIPLVPLKSFRVRDDGPGDRTFLPGWSRKYVVIREERPNIRQVLSVYGFIAGYMAILALSDINVNIVWIFGLAWPLLPFFLRRRARRFKN
jgi:hypothetical protein